MYLLEFLVAVVAVGLLLWATQQWWPAPRIVRAHERAVRYRRGHIIGELGPGRYWVRPKFEELVVVDVRRRQLLIAGQEVLTSDRVPLKVSVVAEFSVTDVIKALTVVAGYQETLYTKIQLALRAALATRDLDSALSERGDLASAVTGLVRGTALEFGVDLHAAEVRDFMMAAGLRNAYADVIQARQQGVAALERARGESAAVRNMANAAQLIERHPGIMQLRLLQAVESGSGNRIVIALDPTRGTSSEVDITAAGDA